MTTQSTIEQMRDVLERIAAYPRTPADELTANGLRCLAREVLASISVKDLIPEEEGLYLAIESGESGDYDIVIETVIQDNPSAYTHGMPLPPAPTALTPEIKP